MVRSLQQSGQQQRQRGHVDLALQPQLGMAHAEYDDARSGADKSGRQPLRRIELGGGVATIGIDIAAGVAAIKERFE